MVQLEQALVAESQPLVDGMCLADWEAVPGFRWDDLEHASDVILPQRLKAAGPKRLGIALEKPGWSPNVGGFGQAVPSPCRLVVWHWWGTPSGQLFDGVVAWLRNPASYVSATIVLAHRRAAQLVPFTTPSWANGNSYANANSITVEADPNNVIGTIETGIELLVQLVREGVLHPDFELTGHRDWYATACPGAYYGWLAYIRNKVHEQLAGVTALSADTEDELMAIDMEDFSNRLRDTFEIEVAGYDRPLTLGNVLEYLVLQSDRAPEAVMKRMVRRQGLPEDHPLYGQDTNLESIVAWFDAAIYALAATQKALANGNSVQAKEIVDELFARIGQLAQGSEVSE